MSSDAGTGGGSATGGGTASSSAITSAGGTKGAAQSQANFGRGNATAVDSSGYAAIAFMSYDQNGDDNYSDSVILFTSYDATAKTYKTPVTAASGIGNTLKLGLQLAIDGSNVAIAYAKDDDTSHVRSIWLAVSTNSGASFTSTQISDTTAASVYGWSALSMKSGIVFMAWNENDKIMYRTGAIATVSTWTAAVIVPLPLNLVTNVNGRLSMAIDSNGIPGLVFGIDSGSNLTLSYWKPGLAVSTTVFATATQNDSWGAVLAYAGTSPRVAFFAGYGTTPVEAVSVTSSTDGTTWTTPVIVPNDGGQAPNDRIAMAVSATGKTAITYPVGGGNTTGTLYHTPKVATSSAFSAFVIGSPSALDYDADYPSMVFEASGKLVLVFQNQSTSVGVSGVLVYREP